MEETVTQMLALILIDLFMLKENARIATLMIITSKKDDKRKIRQPLIPNYIVYYNKHQTYLKSLPLKELKLVTSE